MQIRRLTPDLSEDYFRLFGQSFTDFPEWGACFCAFYDDPRDDETVEAYSHDRNRGYRQAVIDRGGAYGLLAYDDGEPVGWVNAGPRSAYLNLRSFSDVTPPDAPPTGAVMCFVIHPDHRGRGVATALLAGVDDHLRDLGMEVVEAYPRLAVPDVADFPWTAAFYKGSPSMYEKAGYDRVAEHERFAVYRKAL